MNAIEFLKENDRMCKTFDSCSGKDGGEMCELYVKSNEKGLSCADYATTYPEETVKIIEKWSKAHPARTRQDIYLEEQIPSSLKSSQPIRPKYILTEH